MKCYIFYMDLLLADHYEQMWYQASSLIKGGQIEKDLLIDAPADQRYGVTLLIRPGPAVARNIITFLQEARQREPDQYYYPSSDLHLTVLSVISCYAGFRLDQVDTEAYASRAELALNGLAPFKLHFRGITASPSSVLIQGFPQDQSLQLIRNRLRKLFQNSGLQHSIDSRYKIVTAHSTVIRFRKQLRHAERFWQFLEDHRNTDFGSFTVSKMEILGNNWYQQKNKTELIRQYSLKQD